MHMYTLTVTSTQGQIERSLLVPELLVTYQTQIVTAADAVARYVMLTIHLAQCSEQDC